jgi:hypothetical protein
MVHVAQVGEMRNTYKILVGKTEGKDVGRCNNKMDPKELDVMMGLVSFASGQGQVAGSCDHGNASLRSVEGEQFLN